MRIVGFEFEPCGIGQSTHANPIEPCGITTLCQGCVAFPVDLWAHGSCVYTCSAQWAESPLSWATRWDGYHMVDGRVGVGGLGGAPGPRGQRLGVEPSRRAEREARLRPQPRGPAPAA